VDLERFEPALDLNEAKKGAGIPLDKRTVGYCGHLYRGRGIEELLACAAGRSDLLFIFAGGNPADVERYRVEAKNNNLANVLFTGFVPNRDIPKWLYASDILVMPYTRGTRSAEFMSPMKMFEYMAAGRPIVAPRFESTCEVLEHERNAVLIPESSTRDLMKGIDRALSDPRSFDYARQAKLDVRKYSWQNRAREILDFCSVEKI
jgi:glycosyltransferase involved in cell wall biosynthesis